MTHAGRSGVRGGESVAQAGRNQKNEADLHDEVGRNGGSFPMAATQIEAKVKNIIAEQLGVGEDEIKPESNFVEDLGADSLDIVELVMAMEEEFEVEIPDEEAENIKTVGDAIKYINEHKK